MDISLRRVSELIREAGSTLQAAQQTCSKTDLLMLKTRSLCDDFNHNHSIRSPYIAAFLESQCRLMERIHECMAHQQRELQTEIGTIRGLAERKIRDLERVVAVLQDTAIDEGYLEFLLKERNRDSKPEGEIRTLFDFISTNNMEELKSELEVTLANHEREFKQCISSSFEKFDAVMGGYRTQFRAVVADLATSAEGEPSLPEELAEILDDNDEAGQEMATIIQNLTQHYDQCMKVREMQSGAYDPSETRELFGVVSNDSAELPKAAKALETVQIEVIENYEFCVKEVNALAQANALSPLNLASLDLVGSDESPLQTLMKSCLTSLRRFSNQQFKKDMESISDFSEDLIGHYNQFIKSYYNMMIEIRRRKTVAAKINKIIQEELRLKMEQVEASEAERRGNFWAENGDFLPNDLVLPDFIKYLASLPRFEIIQYEEHLPDIKDDSLLKLEKYIVYNLDG
ncbi:hypothetical protein BABINDRAFT_161721 [Babjeviella inositovora NRRL Y-12698]|uniref:Autophagy-related protein 17 n=1 Tax=Babjeviella inositovora NRRL Y-12698 TaxID=984486 RepID=A0A1E3QNM4_9ASCO|nr:uncharacterized protein BABINDRAFT_161721 [Babjeviella inositovora NRRL Y-12698]ODQ79309.1 hypothetical protein BABINDRAFT_161721 [Babjeviella inositovora NRRL Y-12698]